MQNVWVDDKKHCYHLSLLVLEEFYSYVEWKKIYMYIFCLMPSSVLNNVLSIIPHPNEITENILLVVVN